MSRSKLGWSFLIAEMVFSVACADNPPGGEGGGGAGNHEDRGGTQEAGAGGSNGVTTGSPSSSGASGSPSSTTSSSGASGGAPGTTSSTGASGGPSSTTSSTGASGGAPGTTTSSGTGGPIPQCGDHICNGGETSSSCCVDCPCGAGSSCIQGTCKPNPTCGDHICNGTETQASCCADCGCSGSDQCVNNQCVCTEGVLHMENVLPDATQLCINLNQWYTQKSVAYVKVGNGQWVYMPDGGWMELTDPIGTTYSGVQQCCYLDPCLGNLSCPTPFGNSPCICTQPTSWSATINACGVKFFPVCN